MTNMNQNGRSMIEMLGVLAIIGVLSVGGIAGYSKAMLKYKTNKTIDEITMLTTNIRTLYAQQKTFTGLDNLAAVNMGVVPDEMIKNPTVANGVYSAATLKHPFNGEVTIVPSPSIDGAAGTNRAFEIRVVDIPKEACMAIATSDWGSNYSSGLIALGVGADATNLSAAYAGNCTSTINVTKEVDGKNVTSTTGFVCAADMPLNVAVASGACNCAGSECAVAFKYY